MDLTTLLKLDGATLAAIAAAVVVLVQAAKQIDWVDQHPKLLPVWAIALAHVVAMFVGLFTAPACGLQLVGWIGVYGLAGGLAASGLYSAGAKGLFGLLTPAAEK